MSDFRTRPNYIVSAFSGAKIARRTNSSEILIAGKIEHALDSSFLNADIRIETYAGQEVQ